MAKGILLIADGLGDLMEHIATVGDEAKLRHDVVELRAAVGVELHESSSRNRVEPGSST